MTEGNVKGDPWIALSPCHSWHTQHGAHFVTDAGWQVPSKYPGKEAEAAVRSGVGLADLSAFAKVLLQGPGVALVARGLLGNDQGDQPRSVFPLAGAVPGLTCRLSIDRLLLLAMTTTAPALDERLASLTAGQPVVRTDATSAYAGFGLIGPSTEEVLRRLTALEVAVSALPPGACAETSLAGVQVLLIRPPQTALPSMLIYVAWDLGEYVWERLLDAGRDQITPLGLEQWRQLAK